MLFGHCAESKNGAVVFVREPTRDNRNSGGPARRPEVQLALKQLEPMPTMRWNWFAITSRSSGVSATKMKSSACVRLCSEYSQIGPTQEARERLQHIDSSQGGTETLEAFQLRMSGIILHAGWLLPTRTLTLRVPHTHTHKHITNHPLPLVAVLPSKSSARVPQTTFWVLGAPRDQRYSQESFVGTASDTCATSPTMTQFARQSGREEKEHWVWARLPPWQTKQQVGGSKQSLSHASP